VGFSIADAFVDIGAKTGGFDSGMSRVKSSVSQLGSGFSALSGAATKVFGLLAAGATYIAKAFGDAEKAESALHAALSANGMEVEQNMKKYDAFAESLQRITTYSKDAIKQGLAYAANLGVTADDMEEVTKAGIGMSTLFGGDIQEGIKAVTEAQDGNFRMLERGHGKLSEDLKRAHSDQERLNIVMAYGNKGMEEAQAQTNTFYGQLSQLHNTVMETAETFGAIFVPQLQKVSTFLQNLAMYLQHLTPEMKQQIIHWAEVGAAIAAVIAFGPAIATFVGTCVAGFVAIAGAVFSLGAALIALVTSPIAIVIAGLATLVTAFAYAIGGGNTFVERTVSGFVKIVEFLDKMLGSWHGFTAGLVTLWHQLEYYWDSTWLSIKSAATTVWEFLKSEFPNVVYGWGGALAEFAVKAWGIMKQLANVFKQVWDDIVNYVADKIAEISIKTQATKDVRDKYEGKTLDAKQARGLASGEVEAETRNKGLSQDEIAAKTKEIQDRYEKQYAGKQLTDAEITDLIVTLQPRAAAFAGNGGNFPV